MAGMTFAVNSTFRLIAIPKYEKNEPETWPWTNIFLSISWPYGFALKVRRADVRLKVLPQSDASGFEKRCDSPQRGNSTVVTQVMTHIWYFCLSYTRMTPPAVTGWAVAVKMDRVTSLHAWNKQGIYRKFLLGNRFHVTLRIVSPYVLFFK